MTDTMRERIAKVLAAADGMHPDAVSNDGDDIPIWETYLDVADAVRAAIREPTEGMVNAGVIHTNDAGYCLEPEGVADLYQAMIEGMS